MTDFKKKSIEPLQYAKFEYKQRYMQSPYSNTQSEEVKQFMEIVTALDMAIDMLERQERMENDEKDK